MTMASAAGLKLLLKAGGAFELRYPGIGQEGGRLRIFFFFFLCKLEQSKASVHDGGILIVLIFYCRILLRRTYLDRLESAFRRLRKRMYHVYIDTSKEKPLTGWEKRITKS